MTHTGSNHPQWKGNLVGYSALHIWVKKRMVVPNECPTCGEDKKLELSNLNYVYNRSLTNWIMECRSCNAKRDYARRLRLGINQKSTHKEHCPICGKEFFNYGKGTCSLACRDSMKALKYPFCKRGHLKALFSKTDSKGRKVCTECRKIRQAEFYIKHPRRKAK